MIDPMRPPERDDFHPRGTLVIVSAFGMLMLLGWLLFYFVVFARRGELG